MLVARHFKNTLTNKTMDDTLLTIRQYEAASSSRHRGDTTTFRCSSSNTACEVYFNVRRGVPGDMKGIHNHDQEPWIPNRNQLYQNLMRRSCEEGLDLKDIYIEEAARYPDAAPHLLLENVLPNMNLCRRKSQPPVPSSLTDYAITLESHPKFAHLYLDTVRVPGGGTAVILGAPGFAEMLGAAETILTDGTFKTLPAGMTAAQILTIHCSINGYYYHPVIALMEHRRRDLYSAVFQRVWELAGHPQPENILTDYERGLQSALSLVSGLPTNGCFFHYTQALMRKARSLHIPVRNNTPGHRLVRLYCTLALMPPDRVPDALAAIPHTARAEGLPFNAVFHGYFEDFWMVQITPEGFTAHGRSHRTTNIAESYHHTLSRIMRGAAPNVWKFTQKMFETFSNCCSRRQAQLAGRPLSKRHRAQNLKYAAAIASNLRALLANSITMRHFLVAVSSRLVITEVAAAAEDVPEVGEEVEVEAEESASDEEIPLPPPAPAPAPAPEPAPAPGIHCGVCQEEPPTRVLIPCGHTLCDDCLNGIQASGLDLRDRCPYCRTHIGSCIAIYF